MDRFTNGRQATCIHVKFYKGLICVVLQQQKYSPALNEPPEQAQSIDRNCYQKSIDSKAIITVDPVVNYSFCLLSETIPDTTEDIHLQYATVLDYISILAYSEIFSCICLLMQIIEITRPLTLFFFILPHLNAYTTMMKGNKFLLLKKL